MSKIICRLFLVIALAFSLPCYLPAQVQDSTLASAAKAVNGDVSLSSFRMNILILALVLLVIFILLKIQQSRLKKKRSQMFSRHRRH